MGCMMTTGSRGRGSMAGSMVPLVAFAVVGSAATVKVRVLDGLPGYPVCWPMAISGDGRTVVGYCGDRYWPPANHVAAIWRDGNAAEEWPRPAGATRTYLLDVSTDGRTMLAAADTGRTASGFDAYRVDERTGVTLLMGDEERPLASVVPAALSGDGRTAVGRMELADQTGTGVLWSGTGTPKRLGAITKDQWIDPLGISRDGSTIVGSMAPGKPFVMPVSSLVAESLSDARGWSTDASADGSVVVGVLTSNEPRYRGFRWTKETGLHELGMPYQRITLGPTYTAARARAVSEDGAVAVGEFWGWNGSGPALWVDGLSPIDFRAMLRLAGWQSGGVGLRTIERIGDDGRTVMGLCVVDGVQKAWIAEIPEICAGDMNFDGLVDDEDFQLFAARYGAWVDFDGSLEEGGIVADGDFNYDGVVDDADFTLFGASYDRLECP